MSDPTDAQLITALKQWGQERGFSQSELAERTGIPQGSISRYFSGTYAGLRSETRHKLIAALPRRLLRSAAPADPPTEQSDVPLVFVSSTYLDNFERRRRVIDTIERAGFKAVAMERWSADERAAEIACMERIPSADLFVGIVAWRYGWIPDKEEKSITELEYQEAREHGVDRLLFVIDERESNVNPARDFDAGRDRWKKQEQLADFKQRIASEQMAVPFTDEDLAVKVFQALVEWRERQQKWRSHPAEEAPPEPPCDLDRLLPDYLEALDAEHGTIALTGFETRLRVPLRLEDLYVPLCATMDDEPPDLDGSSGPVEKMREQWQQSREVSLLEALRELDERKMRRGLVLLGHPGAGKTTELKRILLWMVRQGPSSLCLPADLIPVFLPLRELEETDRSLSSFARRLLGDEDRVGLGNEFAGALWKRGSLLLLVDGLDEVPQKRRSEVRGWIEKVSVGTGRNGNRVVVTCRFEGYRSLERLEPAFMRLDLRPLSEELVESFVHNWYGAVEASLASERSRSEAELRRAEKRARRAAEELLVRLRAPAIRDSRFYELAHTPLLLAALCLVNRDRGRLPERREELYEECVNALLQHWREAKKLPVSFEARRARQVLQPVALWMHQEEGRARAGIDELRPILEKALSAARWDDVSPETFLATIRDESGLLTGWSGETYGFMHLGFQEYLAAREIRDRAFAQAGDLEAFSREIKEAVDHFGKSWWREVVYLMLAGDQPSLFKPFFAELVKEPVFSERTDLVDEAIGDATRFDPAPFIEFLRSEPGDGKWLRENQQMALRLLKSFDPKALQEPDLREVVEKLTAVEADLRTGTATVRIADDVIRPDRIVTAEKGGYELALIPGGSFQMGSSRKDDQGFDDERPQHEVIVPDFYLGRCPVTNEEYGRFLREVSGVDVPRFWGDRRFNQPRQPVVGVSWKDAIAYCKWAGLVLPSESQWEYACRADSDTRYWSGDKESDLKKVGWYAGNSKGLHPVGEKPANAFGLYDMHGNVWEWCQDNWSSDYKESAGAHPGPYEVDGLLVRVCRGGSFGSSARLARSACRIYWRPGDRLHFLGFRPARVSTS